jgi:triphosphatase
MAEEIKLKLLIDPADVLKLRRMPALKTWSTAKPVSQKLVTTYYDTPDLALRHAGIVLRVRRVGRGWIQTIKESGAVCAGLHQHMEWEGPVAGPTPDLSNITDPALLKLFSHHGLRNQLEPVFITAFRRTNWLLSFAEGEDIELALDQGELKAGQSVAPLCEVELELKAGRPDKLYEVALQFLESIKLMPENRSKAERGYAQYSGAPAMPVKATSPGLSPSMSANEAFKVIIASCITHMQANQGGVLLGQDPEYLHQMRVALRRLRSAQSLFGSVIPRATYPEISDGLKWLAEQLGPARDWDVLVTETLPPLMAQFPGQKAWTALRRRVLERQQHYNEIARAAVRSRGYAKLMLTLGAWVEQEVWRVYLTGVQLQELAVPVDELARQILDRWHKQLRKRGRNLTHLSVAERHAVRIAAKKLRYAAEFFSGLYAQKQAQVYLDALAGLQDGLGMLNDIATTHRLLAIFHTPRTNAENREAIGIALGWVACRGTQLLPSLKPPWETFLQQKSFWRE